MNTKQKILYLLNPHANEGKARTAWKYAQKKYPHLPKTSNDITKITDLSSFIKKISPDLIIIAGGDGTINTVCNAIKEFPKKPLLTIFPMGFGNTLAYSFGVETMEKAIDVVRNQQYAITIDGMKTNIDNYPFGLFNISVGFDARIVHNRMNFRYIGLRSYIISAIRSFLYHPEKEITFIIDHKVTVSATASSLVIANCPNIGQNYLVSRHAKLNDGLLDCTLFSTKYAYLTNLRLRGFKHPLYSEIGKAHFKASHIHIKGEPFMQIDGEPVVQQNGLEIEIVPKQFTFLRNDIKNLDQYELPFTA